MGKLRGEKDIEATIQRLDRLTLDEGRATAAQTLEVVCGLVQHKRAIMDGENSIVPFFLRFLLNVNIPRRRQKRIGNWYLTRSRCGFNRLALIGRYNV
jgi:predicted SnoaL-like aldol condensation-catalyzing enzyme